MRAGPGTMAPPRWRPPRVTASMVSAVPTLATTTARPRASACAPMRRHPAIRAEPPGIAIAIGDAARALRVDCDELGRRRRSAARTAASSTRDSASSHDADGDARGSHRAARARTSARSASRSPLVCRAPACDPAARRAAVAHLRGYCRCRLTRWSCDRSRTVTSPEMKRRTPAGVSTSNAPCASMPRATPRVISPAFSTRTS